MSEKNSAVAENVEAKRERFEFVLKINEFIICQRYFRINGWKRKAYQSEEFLNTFNYCVNLIKEDLKHKTMVYLETTAPQVFNSIEEMKNYSGRFNMPNPKHVVVRNCKDTFIWDGEDYRLYEGDVQFPRTDYVNEDKEDYTFRFSFLDNGREVLYQTWDDKDYPRFVRNNIDLSNTKNSRLALGAKFEPTVLYLMSKDRKDLIPQIIHELCVVCSYENDKDYTPWIFGNDDGSKGKVYPIDIKGDYERKMYHLGVKLNDKTNEYQNFGTDDIVAYVERLDKKYAKRK